MNFSGKDNISEHLSSLNIAGQDPRLNIEDVFDVAACVLWVQQHNLKRVCLQFPDSLLCYSVPMSLYLQDKCGVDFYILADTSYGSCCVDEVASQHVDADGIIHFGHACLSPTGKIPVLYIFEKLLFDVDNFTAQFKLKFQTEDFIILLYDVSIYHVVETIREKLLEYTHLEISKLNFNNSTLEEIPNSGSNCLFGRTFLRKNNEDYTAVYMGSDDITLNNFALYLNDVKWFLYETRSKQLIAYSFLTSRFLMKRMHLVEKVKECNVVGILVGTLGINNYLDCVDRVRRLCKLNGKKSYILAVGKPNVPKLANFPEIDVFVFISCPENSLSRDSKEYYKPIVSMFEIELALGNRDWDSKFMSDFRELLPGGCAFQEKLPVDEAVVCNEVVERNNMTVAQHSGADFLLNRSWRGLEPNVGKTEVEKAVEGRSGIAQGYTHETN